MKGKELVFIHGWAADSTVWRYTAESLGGTHRVHPVNLPPMTDVLSYRDAVINLIEEKGLKRAYLIGWSLGALVSLQVIQAIPEQIGGLVMVGGTGRFTKGETYNAGLPPEAVLDMKSQFAQDPELTTKSFFEQMFSGEEIRMGLDKRITAEVLSNMRKWGSKEALSGLDFLLECDLLPSLPGILRPALIIHGNRDRICPHKAAQYLNEKIPDSSLITIRGAGHIPFLTNQTLFNEHLREWLAP